MAEQKLKYLFRAEFDNGTVIAQNPEDISHIDEKRSCFYDVLQFIEAGNKLVYFRIQSLDETWAVDLEKGIFIHNGNEFIATPEQNIGSFNPDFQLIYFRQVRKSFNETYRVGDNNIADLEKSEFVGTHTVYFIGWQCNVKGKNYQQLIGVM